MVSFLYNPQSMLYFWFWFKFVVRNQTSPSRSANKQTNRCECTDNQLNYGSLQQQPSAIVSSRKRLNLSQTENKPKASASQRHGKLTNSEKVTFKRCWIQMSHYFSNLRLFYKVPNYKSMKNNWRIYSYEKWSETKGWRHHAEERKTRGGTTALWILLD